MPGELSVPVGAAVMSVRPEHAGVSADLAALYPGWVLVDPPRFNFAGVRLYCETRGCTRTRCVDMHARSVWAICDDCDGTCWRTDADLVRCCALGIVQLNDRPDAFVSAVPDTSPDVPVSGVPVSVPPVLLSVPVPRCLTCGHRTAVGHDDCAVPADVWRPCADCAGRRVDSDGFECQSCCGVGFVPESASDTLADRAGEVTPW